MFIKDPQTPEQLEALALSLYINELGERLQSLQSSNEGKGNEAVNTNEDLIPRSPSPPPEYDREGRRTNTRYMRTVKTLEIERTLAVHRALELIPNYTPPPNFTKLTRSTQKFFLPVHEYPQINFIGLLLGPRGKNLRRMELEAGAKISIRGRGSVKEGSRMSHQPNEEDLHCLVSSTSQQSIQRASALIQEVVDTAIKTPDNLNDYKRSQLRELAQLNGTLRDDENQASKKPNHKNPESPQRRELKVGHHRTEYHTVQTNVDDFMSSIANIGANSLPGPSIEDIFKPQIPPGTDAPVVVQLEAPPPSWTPGS